MEVVSKRGHGWTTKGKSYTVESENTSNYVITDDRGFTIGYRKEEFESVSDKQFSIFDLSKAIDMARVIVDGKYAHSSEEIFQSLKRQS